MGGAKSKASATGSATADKYKLQLKSPSVRSAIDLLELQPQNDKNRGFEFFQLFSTIDQDGSGAIDLKEFHHFFQVERTPFSDMIFSSLGKQAGNRDVPFDDFIINLWNFGTMLEEDIRKFVFELYDDDRGGTLDQAECESMLRMLYNTKNVTKEQKAKIKAADKNKDGEIDFDEFIGFTKKNKDILAPAFELQKKIQSKAFGKNFWKEQAKKRKQMKLQSTDELFSKHEQLTQKTKEASKNKKSNSKKIVVDADQPKMVKKKSTPGQPSAKERKATLDQANAEKEFIAWSKEHQHEDEITYRDKYRLMFVAARALEAVQNAKGIDIAVTTKLRHEHASAKNHFERAEAAVEARWEKEKQVKLKAAEAEGQKLAKTALGTSAGKKSVAEESKNLIKQAKITGDPVPTSKQANALASESFTSNKIKAMQDKVFEEYDRHESMLAKERQKIEEEVLTADKATASSEQSSAVTWTQAYDEASGSWYYVSSTGETSWDPPTGFNG